MDWWSEFVGELWYIFRYSIYEEYVTSFVDKNGRGGYENIPRVLISKVAPFISDIILYPHLCVPNDTK